MPRWSMSRMAIATNRARCSARPTRRFANFQYLIISTVNQGCAAWRRPGIRNVLAGDFGFAPARPGMTTSPKRRRTNSRWPSIGINYPANRPDPDCPGGLGAEESGAERTGPTQGSFIAIHEGGRWAEVGRYYDSANDPVTAWMGDCRPGFRKQNG